MREYQKIFDKIIKEQIQNTYIEAVEHRLKGLGYILTKEQMELLKEQAAKGNIRNLSLSFNENQLPPNMSISNENEDDPTIILGDMDDLFQELTVKFENWVEHKIPEITARCSAIIYNDLKNNASDMLRERRELTKHYNACIADVWGPSFDLLETLIVIVSEFGEDLNEELRMVPDGKQNLIEVTTRLFARACQVAREILALLRSGYADGAHARWRCLYEIVVTLIFITENKEDTAERYLQHEAIESYKAMKLHQKHMRALGDAPLDKEIENDIERERGNLILKYGKGYDGMYGWAAHALGKKKPTFMDIEECIMAHMRPHYNLASYNVHASPKGIFYRLGIYYKDQNLLLTGPSELGLEEAGVATAHSLYQAATAFFNIETTMDQLVICEIIKKFSDDTQNAYMEAKNFLDERMRESESEKTEI